jgi:CheY-like chemotaxis protein
VAQIADGSYVMLAVTDTGCGMPPEMLQRIFEPFYTTKGLGRGTGLGLSTVYAIVEQSGGHIYLDSEVGVGTTFTILLPRSDEPVQPKPVEVSGERGGTETILLLDDDPGVRGFAQDVLTAAGYVVLAASDGPEAIRLAAVHAEEIDLFLTDMMLQGMQGNVVAEKVRRLLPQARILYMSGYTENAPPDEADFLDKPFKPAQLTAKVRQMLDTVVPDLPAKRVLVVDDESSIRSLLKQILEDAGFEVLVAANGREAQTQFQAGPVDLVITDLMMPEMDGIQFIGAMRKQWPDVKLVATTGETGHSLLRAAQLLGAHATLPKPLDAASILSCVRELVEA